MKHKSLAVIAAACLAVCLLLTGCSVDLEKYPPIEAPDVSAMTLETIENSDMTVQYPSGTWVGVDGTVPLTVYYADTMDSDNTKVNINVQQASTYSGTLDEKFMNDLVNGLTEAYPSMDIRRAELRSVNGKGVIYMETVTTFTEEMVSMALESGMLAQEDIDAAGGMEALLASIPPTDQIMIYAVNSVYLYIYTGTYYEESQKDDVLNGILVMIQTTKDKPKENAMTKLFQ